MAAEATDPIVQVVNGDEEDVRARGFIGWGGGARITAHNQQTPKNCKPK
jgi:hypothetical protein